MKTTKTIWKKSLLKASVALLVLFVQVNVLQAATPNIIQQTNTVTPNTTPNYQNILQSGVSCTGKIFSEGVPSTPGLIAYSYQVDWTITAHSVDVNDNYDINYGGTGVLSGSDSKYLDHNIPNPYTLPRVTYSFKKTDPDKNATLSVKLTNYSVTPNKIYNGSCSLNLKNKGAVAAQPAQTNDNGTSTLNTIFVVKEVTPVTTPTTNLTPAYTFSTNKSGKITYGGNCSSATTTAAVGNNTIIFNNLSVGTYSNCTIMVTDSNNNNSTVLKVSDFTIQAAASSNSNSNSNSSNSSNTVETTQSESVNTSSQSTTLFPSPDILTCKARAKKLFFEFDLPAYDRMGLDCTLNKPAIVNVGVYNETFDVKAADNSGNLLKSIWVDKYQNQGTFYVSWDGYDDYDQAAALGEANFVVGARLANTYAPDTSVQKFSIENAPGKGAPEEASAEDLHGAAENTDKPGILETVANAVFGGKEATAPNPVAEASKCPGVNYPTDIENSSFKAVIRAAYDICLVKGYEDGTFRPDQGLTRAEATKIIVLATGNIAKQGCYDADCGSPFNDLVMWQGPWIRSAWDTKTVSGVGPNTFAPNRQITRAEAAALVVKAFKIPPHQGCYSANCGAGYPNDFFNDVRLGWQGPYLRALWDMKAITTVEPGKFYPDIPISRAVFLDWAIKMRGPATAAK
ncbi:S-layer homology domain-containing protein [Candidatus Peregrinibacteria bacterium]|nr:S-layer homology domain-containing protein [Candidatus Peregrinibacteria bacterium]